MINSQYFIRYNAAASIANRMKYLGESLATASRFVVKDLGENDGLGGIISVDDQGNCKPVFHSDLFGITTYSLLILSLRLFTYE